jgi:hypothetical protein
MIDMHAARLLTGAVSVHVPDLRAAVRTHARRQSARCARIPMARTQRAVSCRRVCRFCSYNLLRHRSFYRYIMGRDRGACRPLRLRRATARVCRGEGPFPHRAVGRRCQCSLRSDPSCFQDSSRETPFTASSWISEEAAKPETRASSLSFSSSSKRLRSS